MSGLGATVAAMDDTYDRQAAALQARRLVDLIASTPGTPRDRLRAAWARAPLEYPLHLDLDDVDDETDVDEIEELVATIVMRMRMTRTGTDDPDAVATFNERTIAFAIRRIVELDRLCTVAGLSPAIDPPAAQTRARRRRLPNLVRYRGGGE